jgi:hypothetical protein
MPKHILSVTEEAASCSCKRWKGLLRPQTETQGAFTLRARDEHQKHFEDAIATGAMAKTADLFDFQASLFGGAA